MDNVYGERPLDQLTGVCQATAPVVASQTAIIFVLAESYKSNQPDQTPL
ncbi:hypothetical protein [Mesorhizobium sp.]|nr:hypothetical protein [Mesorhizobium sp.]